jgi:hypothetical protein
MPRFFLRLGWTNIVDETLLARSKTAVIGSRLDEAEPPVGATADHIRVVVVLAVILPEADRADVGRTSLV